MVKCVKILLLNPNTSDELTKILAEAAHAAASPDTVIVDVTAPRGVPYIASRTEAQIGGTIALEVLADYEGSVDAAIIAAFGDPGLLAARELFDIPIVGMAEAAMLLTSVLGRKFSIVTFSPTMRPWYQECVEVNGMSERCASIRTATAPIGGLADIQADMKEALVALCEQAVEEDGADAIILGGAPLAGFAPIIRDRVSVPVIDQVGAAVKLAESLVSLNPRKAIAGSFRRPDAKEVIGIGGALARRIEHTE